MFNLREVTYIMDDDEVSIKNEEFKEKVQWKGCSYIPQGSMHVLNSVMQIKDHFIKFYRPHSKESLSLKREEYEETMGKHNSRIRVTSLDSRIISLSA